ncbi:MAG: hypothetical protein K9I94_13385 [Bacteroidales bacterium]|nr:hypothetical protein [Bacteroidales bacterium]
MKHITIDTELKEKIEHITLGCISTYVKIGKSPEALIDELKHLGTIVQDKYAIENIAQIPAIKNTREAYKALGKQPSRYRVSSEALHRRLVQGKGLYFINNAVDITNYMSIKSGYGICTFDAEKIDGDVLFRKAREGETYIGIGKYELNISGLPVFADNQGPFGSPTSDSERTMTSENTTSLLMIFVAFNKEPHMKKWLEEASALLRKYALANGIEMEVIER